MNLRAVRSFFPVFVATVIYSLPLLLATWCLETRAADLVVTRDEASGKIVVTREGESEPIVTQNARPDFRPFLHPIVAPDGKGLLTEYSPGHHKHQTGLYWGFTRVNGRDYFHHPEGDFWRRVSADVLKSEGHEVSWRTVYEMLDDKGQPVLEETQTWTMHEHGAGSSANYLLELEWQGKALSDVTIGKYDYGGLFLRMPWKPGIKGSVVNGARQVGAKAEGQRAPWVDVGMQVEGREDLAHVAIFDHGENKGYPQHWRVDGQMGVGPIRAREGDWTIKKGETETIRHGVHVYTGELNDRDLTEKWSDYSGVGGTWALWGLAQKEGREAKFLSAQEAVDTMTLPEGFTVNAYANEPMITQPMAFCWDDRGRMWIAENRDYESRGKGFANDGNSRILILEDTDRDGVADSRKVFCEGIPFPSAIAVGFDGLFLGAVPNLLFVPDRDHDDKADMDDIEVRLTGWGIRDRHETLNSFHWGPDGWLYGCQGFATPSQVGKPAGKGRLYKHKDKFPDVFAKDGEIKFDGKPAFIDGGVFRYHPTKEKFEVVAHGFSNPWGIDYDAKGQLFISACVIPHLWHVIPGGIYHRQGGSHINKHYYSDIRTIADHRHRSAHGGARIYIGDAFPEKYHDRIFMANIHEHAVLTDILEPSGSGFIGRHGDDFMLANNAQWIGFSMEIGPEGAVYVLDWHDADICGKEVLQKDTGRVYRMTSTEVKPKDWPGRYDDLNTFDDLRLAKLQTSPSAWHARRARVILQHRASKSAIEASAVEELRRLFQPATGADPDHRLRAMWALHVTKTLPEVSGDTDVCLFNALADEDEHVRAWAIQLAYEDGPAKQPDAKVRGRALTMADKDASAVVRLYLTSAMQRMESADDVWQIAESLVQKSEDAADHNLPKMIWFSIEPHVVAHPGQALLVASKSQLPSVTRFVARRLADDNKFDQVVAAIGSEVRPGVQAQLLSGLLDSLDGRKDPKAPGNWASVYTSLDKGGDIGRLSVDIAQKFGDRQAVAKLLASLKDSSADEKTRRDALRGLASQSRDELRSELPKLLESAPLRREAIRAIAQFDDDGLTKSLLDNYASFDESEKLDAVQTLASRRSSARALTERLESGDIPKRDVPAYVARQMRRVVGNSFIDVWGPIDALSFDKIVELEKYQSLLTADAVSTADPSHGRAVFNRTCKACHKLYDEGGAVGPDITGANRASLEYLLGNVLTPSAVIQDAYKMTLILTDEGRTYSGIVAGETERQLQLRVAGEEQPVLIPKSSIDSREIAPVSMMPDGLLGTLKDQEVLDLIAYLQSTKQVPLKTE